jgi:hypothetical protein
MLSGSEFLRPNHAEYQVDDKPYRDDTDDDVFHSSDAFSQTFLQPQAKTPSTTNERTVRPMYKRSDIVRL